MRISCSENLGTKFFWITSWMLESQQSSLPLLATSCKTWDFLHCRTKKELHFHLLLYEVIKLYQLRTPPVSACVVDQEPYFFNYIKMQIHLLVYVSICKKISPGNPVQLDSAAAECNTYQYFIITLNTLEYFCSKLEPSEL